MRKKTPFLFLSRKRRFTRYIKKIPNLVGYWPLNEKTGTVVTNRAPVTTPQFPGAVQGSITLNQPGKIGNGFDFSSGQVVIADDNLLDFTGPISGFAIIKPDTFGTGSAGRIFEKQLAYNLFISSTNNVIAVSLSGNTKTSNNNAIVLGEFQMIGFSYDGTKIDFYKNGINVGSPAQTVNPSVQSTALWLGDYPVDNRGFDGIMQHIGIVGRALTAAEHLRLARLAGFFL